MGRREERLMRLGAVLIALLFIGTAVIVAASAFI